MFCGDENVFSKTSSAGRGFGSHEQSIRNLSLIFFQWKQSDWYNVLLADECDFRSRILKDLERSIFERELWCSPKNSLAVIPGTLPVQAVQEFKEEVKIAFNGNRYPYMCLRPENNRFKQTLKEIDICRRGHSLGITESMGSSIFKSNIICYMNPKLFRPFNIHKLIRKNVGRLQFRERIRKHP